jgi:hypothetical protein
MPSYDPKRNYKEKLYPTQDRRTLFAPVKEDGDEVEATHVIMGGIVFPWEAKAPYPASGRSILGGLEYNEERDCVKCHICGRWFRCLGRHLVAGEGIDTREYRDTYGLLLQTSLASPGLSKRRAIVLARNPKVHYFTRLDHHPSAQSAMTAASAARSKMLPRAVRCAENRNLRNLCQPQIRHRLSQLADSLGRVPTARELEGSKLATNTIELALGLKMSAVWKSLGWNPRRNGANRANLSQGRGGDRINSTEIVS